MAKYSYEFKHKIVMEYLSGQGGYEYLGKKYDVHPSVICRWVQNYNHFGEESLLRWSSVKFSDKIFESILPWLRSPLM